MGNLIKFFNQRSVIQFNCFAFNIFFLNSFVLCRNRIHDEEEGRKKCDFHYWETKVIICRILLNKKPSHRGGWEPRNKPDTHLTAICLDVSFFVSSVFGSTN